MAKTEDLVKEVWRLGLDAYKQYSNADDLHETYLELRSEYTPKASSRALSAALVDYFGFRRLRFLVERKTIYYNPWHPDSPESSDDTKLIYPSWLDKD